MIKSRNNVIFTIGIDSYNSPVWPDLNNAVLDAGEVAAVLQERYGFDIYPEPLYNEKATRKNILDSLNSLKSYVSKEDNVIVFYAGHGQMNPVSGRGYWIPYGASASIDTFIDNAVIKDFIEDIDARHVMLISDSCFSGTFLSKTRGAAKEISYSDLDRNKSKWMFASGREEKVSDGSPGNHSPFAGYLINYFKVNDNRYTSSKEIVRYVSALTQNASRQSPYGAPFSNVGDMGGEMIFTLKEGLAKQEKLTSRGTTHTVALRNEQFAQAKSSQAFASGKEVLFGVSFIEGHDYLILDNFRFDDDGNKKLSFEGDDVIFGDGISMRLVQRFATNAGLTRYLDEKRYEFGSAKIAFIKASDEIDEVESSVHAIAHTEYLEELLSFNSELMICLHCGERIVDNRCYSVEIDETGLEDAVGMVHFKCIQPTNRILGLGGYSEDSEMDSLDFDLPEWAALLERGQGSMAVFRPNFKDRIAKIAWNSSNHINDGPYCIKITYDDGYSSFVTKGKDVHRFTAADIDFHIGRFVKNITPPAKEGDYAARIVGRNISGFYDYLKGIALEGEKISKVVKYEKARYSKLLDKNAGRFDNDYTPLGILLDIKTEEQITFDGIIPLISNPLEFEALYTNWKDCGFDLGKLKLKIIKSDLELDVYLKIFEKQELIPVIDPSFDTKNLDLARGFIIEDVTEMLLEANTPRWKEGDMAEIVLENQEKDRPVGLLLTDEFVAENGEPSVVWRPIENGVPIEDLQFLIETEVLRRYNKNP